MGDNIGTFVIGLIYIAILYVLVNPSSQGPKFIGTVTSAMVSIVKAATGGGTLSGASSSQITASPVITPVTTPPPRGIQAI